MAMRSDTQEMRVEMVENEYNKLYSSLYKWAKYSDSEMRLHCGELTAQEIRSIKAVLKAILREGT
jgi:hypothetical protein